MRRRLKLIFLTLALGAIVVTPAGGTPGEVLRDFRDDQQLSRDYSTADTQAALARATGSERVALNAAILGRYDAWLLGTRPRPQTAPPATVGPLPPRTRGEQRSNELPRAEDFIPTPFREPATGLPMVVSILGVLALALLVAGAASGVALHRLRRSRSS